MTPLLDYMAAWVANDAERVAAAVTTDCVITECDGPVYRGCLQVRQWAETWFAAGGVVHGWTVVDHFSVGDREAAQWSFECTWAGSRSTFDGASVCRDIDGRVAELREYRTTAPLYEWRGTSR